MRKRAWLLLIALIVVVLIAWTLTHKHSDMHEFGIGGHAVLCVPESDMDSFLLPYNDESKDLKIGSGHTPGFGFLFTADKMRTLFGEYRIVPGLSGHPYFNNLSGSVGFLSSYDHSRYKDGHAMLARDIESIWYAKDSCTSYVYYSLNREMQYKIKCKASDLHASIWSRLPSPQLPMPDPDSFILATCRDERIDIGPYAGKELHTCTRVMTMDGFIVDYRFQEVNAGLILKFDAFLRGKIAEWKKNCSLGT